VILEELHHPKSILFIHPNSSHQFLVVINYGQVIVFTNVNVDPPKPAGHLPRCLAQRDSSCVIERDFLTRKKPGNDDSVVLKYQAFDKDENGEINPPHGNDNNKDENGGYE